LSAFENETAPINDGQKMQFLQDKHAQPVIALFPRASALLAIVAASAFPTADAQADENGISFWVPGIFGSLAAAPLTPG
jgi:hypothetical protein